jgi:SAM-dependent methyltransferase
MSTNDAGDGEGLTPRDVQEMATAFQRSRVLLTAHELDLFTVLNEEERTADEVAAALGTDRRATERLMNALVPLGLLRKRGERFSNGPLAARCLVRGKPDFMAGLMHTAHLWETWGALTQTVRSGRPPDRPAVSDRGDSWVRPFIAAMHWRGRQTGPEVVGLIDLTGVSRVLDVGGGSGAYAMAFVRAGTGITATVFDLPNVLPLTRSYVESEALSSQVETAAGDYLKDDLPAGFDVVFLSAVVHSNSFEDNRRLIRKAAGALNAGGQVVVVDSLMNEGRSGPLRSALFGINMLVGTEEGDTYTQAEIEGWMTAAGLSRFVRKDTSYGTSLVVGRR